MRRLAKILIISFTLVLAGFSISGLPAQVHAGGAVTDTLTIKVGYWGMPADTFVEKGTYRWDELDDLFGGSLPSYKAAFSFYRAGDDGTYQTIIDSARGISISQLLDYAGVDRGSISNISFYTKDQTQGEFTSFSYSDLFESQRYYFDNLSFYLVPQYDDHGNFTGVQLDERVWDNKVIVEPMLAFEDSWDGYELGQEHTAPNYESMTTGNRFRLLFGQTHPTESRTSQTAKYVHTLYISYRGVPRIVNTPSEIGGEVGKMGKTSFSVAAADSAMIQSMIQSMTWSSSDESVLHIENVTMKQNSSYDDVVDVEISYKVLKEGNASIQGSYGGMEAGGESVTVAATGGTGPGAGDVNNPDPGTPGPPGTGGESGQGGNPSNEEATINTLVGKIQQNDPGKTPEGIENKEKASDQKENDGKQEQNAKAKRVYLLDKEVASLLNAPPKEAPKEETKKEAIRVHVADPVNEPLLIGTAGILAMVGIVGERISFRRKI
ncbi:MAG: hypothetical protein ACOYJU_03165 [Anaerovoracaceae bacterium]|jgi:hypothetical protein